ncbi:MAG: hypothetical protein MUO50_13355, partial [Longimicrobiales bacterium]|nr:hypothetical protein [Longimicrobiales bacterium]
MVVRIHPGQYMPPEKPLFRRPRCAILLLGSLLAVAGPLRGQQFPPDSSELRQRARRAQEEFEATHRKLLPEGVGRWNDRCDEYVGRLCLTESDLQWEPAEEDVRVVSARASLLDALEFVGKQIPGDAWVLGQRIRYLGDTGRWEEAQELALGCRQQEGWWCKALNGYVLHRSGRVVEALDAFSLALAAMEPERAGKWTDPYPLLEYPGGGWLRNPGELSPDEAASRFWALADPLYLTPGNERLSEHYSRHFAPSLYDGSAHTMGLPWGRAFEQILLRYGFAAGWERIPERMERGDLRGVVEHHHPESRGLLPPFEALEDPAGLPEGVWTPQDHRPRTASSPVRAPLIAEGVAQTAVFRRDGNLLILAAYGIPTDTVLRRRRNRTDSLSETGGTGGHVAVGLRRPLWESAPDGLSRDTLAGLFLLADTGSWAPLAAFGVGGEGVLQLSAPPGGYLLSLEQWNPSGRWGARVRHGVTAPSIPPDVPHISDLLLLTAGDGLPSSLSEATPRVRPSTEVMSGSRFTVAWEVYGLNRRREPLTFRISLVEEEG